MHKIVFSWSIMCQGIVDNIFQYYSYKNGPPSHFLEKKSTHPSNSHYHTIQHLALPLILWKKFEIHAPIELANKFQIPEFHLPLPPVKQALKSDDIIWAPCVNGYQALIIHKVLKNHKPEKKLRKLISSSASILFLTSSLDPY